MKLLMCVAVTLALSGTAVTLQAEEYKIGFAYMQRLMAESPSAKKVAEQLEKEFGARQRDLSDQQKKLKDMEDRLTKDSAIMSESEKARQERDMVNLQRDIKRSQDELREDFTFRRNEEIQKIQQEVLTAIAAVGKAGNFDLVLNEAGVVHISNKVDITQQVLDYLNKQGEN